MNVNKCTYITSSGKKCTRPCIIVNGIKCKNCHIKSHWVNKDEFNTLVNRLNILFINETIPVDPTSIINTRGDGACLYRVFANYFLNHVDKLINSNLIDKEKLECSDLDKEHYLAFEIQKELNNYIYHNKDRFIKQCGQTLEDIVLETHSDNISCIEEYNTLYNIFAGDDDYITEETILENGKKEITNIEIADRWGSTAEQIAFSLRFRIKINVYLLQKIDTRSLKIIEVTKRAKNIRLKLLQSIDPILEGGEHIDNTSVLNIVLEKHRSFPHYQYISD